MGSKTLKMFQMYIKEGEKKKKKDMEDVSPNEINLDVYRQHLTRDPTVKNNKQKKRKKINLI